MKKQSCPAPRPGQAYEVIRRVRVYAGTQVCGVRKGKCGKLAKRSLQREWVAISGSSSGRAGRESSSAVFGPLYNKHNDSGVEDVQARQMCR